MPVSYTHLDVYKRQNVMLAQQKVLKRSKEEAEKIAVEELTKVCLLYTSRCV